MNGEVNGTMETPVEASDKSPKSDKKVVPEQETVSHKDGDSGEDESSSDDDNSEASISRALAEADTVSINSDSDSCNADESSQNNHSSNDKNNDIILVENDDRPVSLNKKSISSNSPEVQEILSDNDDCIVTDEKSNSSNCETENTLRRSSRAIIRKTYNDEEINGDDESDVEEIEMDDPLENKTNSTVVKGEAKTGTTAKKIKMNHGNQKKEPTVVILDNKDSKALLSQPKPAPANISTNAQMLYQSIVACGTTVTPVKVNPSVQSPPVVTQPTILPSLTDDMFVVEAPSFVVPYVYEKPSLEPFREFVDILGKELEEQRAKEEKERLEKEKEEAEKREKEKQERRERGEEVSEDEAKANETESEEKKQKKAEKKERRRRKRDDDDDASWDGESSSESEDETLSDEDTFILKDKEDSIEEIKDITDVVTAPKVGGLKTDNYFDCSLGKFFVTIGLNLVQEYVQSDLLKQQNRKLNREKKTGHSTKATETSIASLMKNLEFSKENNAPYHLTQKKCDFCSFKTESTLVMQHHLEVPHMKNSMYKCNFCPNYLNKLPHEILIHVQCEHKVRARLERAPSHHQCPNCPFEDNGKGKFARHQVTCAKKFKPETNLAPPIEWEPPAKIPKISKARSMVNTYQSAVNRQGVTNMNKPISITNLMAGAVGSGFRPRGRSPMAVPPRPANVQGSPMMRGGLLIRQNMPSSTALPNYAVNNGKTKSQPSISITPLPRQTTPAVVTPSPAKSTFVICEICDGYIKDLEQLRNHMQWIHKVKIHPKMIYNRPPLNCQKCQFRFFTDQGLERHLLGSHGLVTSSMQEAANKGKDAGRCPVCGRVYQWKLLNHVARDHNLTLKPAHLSYKCTVCTATFGMYKQFESHVYSAHSVVAKRVMDKNKTSVPATDAAKLPKVNDQITVTTQPSKTGTSSNT